MMYTTQPDFRERRSTFVFVFDTNLHASLNKIFV